MKHTANLAAALLLGLFLLGSYVAAQQPPVVVRASAVFDGRGNVLRNQRIAVDGSRIVRVEPDTGGAATYDLRGLTVMPGWIDTHVHIGQYVNAAGRATGRDDTPEISMLYMLENAYVTLMGGVTTAQSIGSRRDTVLREAIARGILPGPRLLTSLEWVTEEAGAPDAIREQVRQRHKAGANVIKVFASRSSREGGGRTLDDAQLQAACGEAKRLGLRSIAHAHSADSIEAAIRNGCSTITHGTYSDDRLLQMMVERGIYFEPQFLVTHNYLEHKSTFLGLGNYTEEGFAFMEKNLPVKTAMFRKAAQIKGLKLVWGTDAVARAHGRNAEEFVYRVREGGQNPMAAFVSAHSVAAESLSMADRIGTLAAGFEADIIALDGDPLADITAVRRVVFVMKGGKVYKHLASSQRRVTDAANRP
jgi:imidazolonepropionase-like amidohydrolase